jgi:hypothetical protein
MYCASAQGLHHITSHILLYGKVLLSVWLHAGQLRFLSPVRQDLTLPCHVQIVSGPHPHSYLTCARDFLGCKAPEEQDTIEWQGSKRMECHLQTSQTSSWHDAQA